METPPIWRSYRLAKKQTRDERYKSNLQKLRASGIPYTFIDASRCARVLTKDGSALYYLLPTSRWVHQDKMYYGPFKAFAEYAKSKGLLGS